MLSLVGGKWTTFRALGRTLGNKVLSELGVSPIPGARSLPIGGGRDYPKTPAALETWYARRAGRAPRARLEVLLQRYGTRADAVLQYIGPNDPTLPGCPELSAAEVRYLGIHEQLGALTDVFIRRTSLAFRGRVTETLLAQVAEALAPVLGWDPAETAAQVDECRRVLTEEHGARVALSNA